MKFKYILGLGLIIVLIAIYYRYNPGMYNFFPECPFHKYLHLDCPGCGSQRAVHALLHGNLLLAADYNVLLVISLPFLLIHFICKLSSHFSGKQIVWSIWYKPATPKIIFVIVMVFWVLRNVPVEPFTYLAA